MNLGQKPNTLADKRVEPDALIENVLLELPISTRRALRLLAEAGHLKPYRNKLTLASPALVSSSSPIGACRAWGGEVDEVTLRDVINGDQRGRTSQGI